MISGEHCERLGESLSLGIVRKIDSEIGGKGEGEKSGVLKKL